MRDYRKIDYINSILNIYPDRKIKSLRKNQLVNIYLSIINKDLYFENNIKDIIKIQSLFRKKKKIVIYFVVLDIIIRIYVKIVKIFIL